MCSKSSVPNSSVSEVILYIMENNLTNPGPAREIMGPLV